VAEPPGDPKGYELAFDEGKRALAEQAEVLKETRDRVGTVVSAAAVVVGLGVGFAFNTGERAGDLSWWGVAATIVAALAFGGVALSAAMIWRPLAGAFVIDSGVLVGSYLEADPAASLVEMHRELAVHLGRNAQRNSDQLQRRLIWFNMALVAFVLEVVALMVALIDVVSVSCLRNHDPPSRNLRARRQHRDPIR
jgi:hypothetical protein